MDEHFWVAAILCLGALAIYCRGVVGVVAVLAYPHLQDLPKIIGGIPDSYMLESPPVRLFGVIGLSILCGIVIAVWPLIVLATLNRPGNVSFHFWAFVEVVLAVAWTVGLVRWTRRRMRASPPPKDG